MKHSMPSWLRILSAVMAMGLLSVVSNAGPFEENRLMIKTKEIEKTIDSLKNESGAESGAFVSVDLGPLSATLAKPQEKRPELSIGTTALTGAVSVSTSGEVCRGNSYRAGEVVAGKLDKLTCRPVRRLFDPTSDRLHLGFGVGGGAGADVIFGALTAGGFVRVPMEGLKATVKARLNEIITRAQMGGPAD